MDPENKQVNHKTKDNSILDRERDRTKKFQLHCRFFCHRCLMYRPPPNRIENKEGPTPVQCNYPQKPKGGQTQHSTNTSALHQNPWPRAEMRGEGWQRGAMRSIQPTVGKMKQKTHHDRRSTRDNSLESPLPYSKPSPSFFNSARARPKTLQAFWANCLAHWLRQKWPANGQT